MRPAGPWVEVKSIWQVIQALSQSKPSLKTQLTALMLTRQRRSSMARSRCGNTQLSLTNVAQHTVPSSGVGGQAVRAPRKSSGNCRDVQMLKTRRTRGLEVEKSHALACRPFLRRCANKATTAAACPARSANQTRSGATPHNATNSCKRSRSDRALEVPRAPGWSCSLR